MKLKLSVLLLVAAILTAGYGAAALTSVSIDRTISAGTVLADTNADVAVKFQAFGTYLSTTGFMSEDVTSGKVTFNLNKLLKAGAAGTGFNTDAQFGLGSASTNYFAITNNTDASVLVNLASVTGGLKLFDTVGEVTVATTIPAGASANFYFKIDTAGVNKATVIGGTLQVR